MPTYRGLLAHSLALRGVSDNLLLAQTQGVSYLLGQLVRFDQLNADPSINLLPLADPGTLLPLALITATLVFAAMNIQRHSALALGILWFFLWLAPTNSLIARNDIANDRQLYLSIAGAGWLLGLGLAQLLQNRSRAAASVALAAIALTLGSATVSRNRVYANEISFWQDVAAKSAGNARAHNNLGVAYSAQCRLVDARTQFDAALKLDPEYFLAAGNLALLEGGEPPGRDTPCP